MSGRFRFKYWWQDRVDSGGNHFTICHFWYKPSQFGVSLIWCWTPRSKSRIHSVHLKGDFKAISWHKDQVAHNVLGRPGLEIELSSLESFKISKLASPLVHRGRNALKENTFWKSSNQMLNSFDQKLHLSFWQRKMKGLTVQIFQSNTW